jgi:hypothetical protein
MAKLREHFNMPPLMPWLCQACCPALKSFFLSHSLFVIVLLILHPDKAWAAHLLTDELRCSARQQQLAQLFVVVRTCMVHAATHVGFAANLTLSLCDLSVWVPSPG